MQTRTFYHFMDGYLSEGVCNFDLANSILCSMGELNRRYKSPTASFKQISKELVDEFTNL